MQFSETNVTRMFFIKFHIGDISWMLLRVTEKTSPKAGHMRPAGLELDHTDLSDEHISLK